MVMRWEPLIDEASQRFGVPQDIITSVMGIESGGRRGAVSPKGASGLMQVMPDTYRELAVKHGFGPDRFEPRNNVMAGAAYLRQNYDQYGNWNDALAAYNAGPGRVQRVKAGTSTLPAETTDYLNNPAIKGVLAQYAGGKTDMPMFTGRAGGATDDEMDAWTSRTGLGGLLNVGTQNWHDGLGLLGPYGQTQSHPPGPGGAAGAPAPPPGPEAPASGGYDVGSRIAQLIQELAQKPKAEPALSRGQYQLAGASNEFGKLAGIHDRPVGIGEMLGALGRGVSGGTLAAQQANRDDRANQFGELGNLAKLQTYQRTESTAAAKIVAAKQYARILKDSGNPQMAQIGTALENDPTLIDEIVKAQAAGIWPKDGSGAYTLSPGQTRFGAGNQPVASVAPQTTRQLSAQEVAGLGLPAGTVAQVDATGKVDVVNKPGSDVPASFQMTDKLRERFTTQAQPLIQARQMYARVEAAYKDTTPTGEIALVFGFMKMLDPTSVVKEGEYATAANAAGVPEKIRQIWNSVMDGNRLAAGVRDNMYAQAQAQYGAIEGQHQQLEKVFRDLAVSSGLDPDQVVIDLRGGVKTPGGAKAPDPSNPKVGDRARNPTTGAMIEWNGSAWVPVQ